MFRIKICGVTNVDDARAAVAAGADAIGLNFYPGSKRCVSTETARSIVEVTCDLACPVGVFVNAPAETICDTCRQVEINTVQLHGDERWDVGRLITGLRDSHVRVIRAHGFGARGLDAVNEDMFDVGGMAADAVLVDATVSGMFGGTGRTIDWSRLVNYESSIGQMPLILAGGLTPENVAEAIRVVRPQAVDVASGVESAPGKKDAQLVGEFVAAAQEAFARL